MRVFVSGTSGDLKSFRKAVAEELQRVGVEAVEQAYFGVDHRKLPMMLKDKVKTCDAVICLVGFVFGAAPPGSSRSYTQMEYDFAQELGKPTFLFFPSPQCKLDQTESMVGESGESVTPEARDTPGQRELQKKHADMIRSSAHIRYEFDNDTHLRLLAAEAVVKISPETAEGAVGRTVRTDFPTPLSLLYDEYIDKDDSLWSLVAESLRFVSLLALHDSVVHRIFGCQSADKKERSKTLKLPENPSDWRSLLRLACPDEGHPRAPRFINEFAGWERRNSGAINRIVQYDDALSKRRNREAKQMVGEVRKAMASIIVDLEFLRRYVLVAVTEVDSKTVNCTATVLRGLTPRSFELATDPQSSSHPEVNQLYLLNVDRCRALWLAPSLKYEGAPGGERVYGWGGLDVDKDNDADSECVTTVMMSGEDRISISERRDTLSGWLGEDLCEDAFGFRIQARPIAWEGKLLDDDSWKKIREVVLPPGGEPAVLGERFRLASPPIHRGLHADVFEATDIASARLYGGAEEKAVAVPTQPVVHVLRAEGAADEQVREWFENRSECWRQTKHARVLRLYESGDPAGKKGLPFLLADYVPGSRSLEQLLQTDETITEKTVMQAIKLAAEVCSVAHQQDIFLLALPTRHFLMDAGNNLLVTGFEAATPGKPGSEFPPSLLQRLSRFCKDVDMMAPEVRRDFGTFAPTLDVFAIGRLLAQLRQLPTLDVLPSRYWNDPWRCLAYHCLSGDPNVRFQSADQILMFLSEWPPRNEPQTVAVPRTQTQPGFSIGKYPVTNAEYKRFCSEKDCVYLWDRGQQDDDQQAELSRRLSGPWLPVTYVSLDDAENYCAWLSEQTRKKWRLPTESEWLRAASRGEGDRYPWGNASPDRSSSNYGRHYRGPTVVGAFSAGRSHADCWDLAGNVWEWCTDIVKNGAPRRVVKGGAYDYSSDALQLTSLDARVVTCRSPHVGFRVLCEEKP
jgi:serine/threonine-protein kinase